MESCAVDMGNPDATLAHQVGLEKPCVAMLAVMPGAQMACCPQTDGNASRSLPMVEIQQSAEA